MNKVRFPIGDWSADGHGRCEYFFATTPLSVQDVREAHFAAPATLGFDIGRLCRDYGDGVIAPSLLEKIDVITSVWHEPEDMESPERLFVLWISLLNYINPALLLTPLTEKDYEDVTFYGVDEQNRHLRNPGYGLFE